LHTVSSLSALDADSTFRAIEELRAASLLDEPEHERFSIHDLVRIFAREMAAAHEADRVGEILDGVFGYLLHSAYACDREIVRGRILPIDDDAARMAFRPDSPDEALAWFDAEYPALLAAIRHAEAGGHGRFAWLLPMVTVTYQWRHRLYVDSRKSLDSAIRAVEQIGSPADCAAVCRLLAGTFRNLDDFPMAAVLLKRALRLSGEAADALGSALAASNLGVVCRESSKPEEAVDYFNRALNEFRSLGDVLGEASALAGLGAVYFDECRYDQALQLCIEALGLFEAMDEMSGVGDTRRMLGRIRAAQGDAAEAIEYFAAARECYRRMGYPPREAEALREVSDLMAGTGRIAEARSALQDARRIYAGLVEPQADLEDIEDRLRRLESSPVTQAGEA
jgi:tetratricopeptide (TPR) repeat protein